jgi:hypothetical protein
LSTLTFVFTAAHGSTTLGLAIMQESTGKLFDFSTNTFASGTPTILTAAFTESTIIPGFYRLVLTTTAYASLFTVGAYDFILYDTSIPLAIGVTTERQLIGADNSGGTPVVLSPNGLDAIVVETNINARQAMALSLAASAGALTGAGSGPITIKGGNVNTTRIVATTDVNGNRTSVTLSPPA